MPPKTCYYKMTSDNLTLTMIQCWHWTLLKATV